MKTIITGISVEQQMKTANDILNNIVIPREKKIQEKKRKKTLSKRLKNALKQNT